MRCSLVVSTDATTFGISIDTTRSTRSLTGNATALQTTVIDGVGALVIEGDAEGCTYALDVSDSQSLRALSGSTAASSEVDCPRAKALAESIMSTLDTLQPS